MTEWYFAFDIDGSCDPLLTKFTTSKSIAEIKSRFGGDNNYSISDDGKALLSIWYFDEYSTEYADLGHHIVNHGATWHIYEANDPKLNKFNLNNVSVVDLDIVFNNKPVRDHGCYENLCDIWKAA